MKKHTWLARPPRHILPGTGYDTPEYRQWVAATLRAARRAGLRWWHHPRVYQDRYQLGHGVYGATPVTVQLCVYGKLLTPALDVVMGGRRIMRVDIHRIPVCGLFLVER